MTAEAGSVEVPALSRPGARLIGSAAVGVAAGAAAAVGLSVLAAVMVGWTAFASALVIWMWLVMRRCDGEQTRARARAEDDSRTVHDGLLLTAAAASLGGVLSVIASSGAAPGGVLLAAAVGLSAVVASWVLVHTVWTTRYAALYYDALTRPPPSGEPPIDFHDGQDPCFADFAYFSFAMGMTYAVSDSDVSSTAIRRACLSHTLLSWFLGTGIIAASINLVIQLAG